MKRLSLLVVFLVFLAGSGASASTVINEVMYDPERCDYDTCEWVEVRVPGNFSSRNLTFSDGKNSTFQINSSRTYFIVTENETEVREKFDINENSTVLEGEFSFGTLSNDGESLFLYSEDRILDEFNYTGLTNLADNNGKSLQLMEAGWNESQPTPGAANFENDTSSENTTNSTNQSDDENASAETSPGAEENLIRIMDSPESVKFGGIVDVKVKVSKNGTSKYALYTRIERPSDGWDVSEESKVYLRDKNTNYTFMIPLLVKPNCDGRYGEGDYRLLVEGLGTRDTEEIEISGREGDACQVVEKVKNVTKVKKVSSDCNCSPSPKKFEMFAPDKVHSGDEINTTVILRNEKNSTRNLTVYSYIYRDNKLVSEGGWVSNRRNIILEAGGKRVLVMRNKIKPNVSGTYNLKVRIRDVQDLVKEVQIKPREVDTGNRTSKGETMPGINDSEYNPTKRNNETQTEITGKVFEERNLVEKIYDFFASFI